MSKPNKIIKPLQVGLAVGARGQEVQDLHAYLKAFGYLQADAPQVDNFGAIRDIGLERPEGGSFDEITKNALKRFQAFYGLPETGELSGDTVHLMHTPRCGCPDNPSRLFTLEAAPGLARFVAQGNRWGTPNVTYNFTNFTGDLAQNAIVASIREAFARWGNVCNLTFTEVSGTGDIVIRFVTGDHQDGSPFDGPGRTLAHAFYPPPNGGSIAGDLHFDDAETWSNNEPPSGIDLLTVSIHEIGHSLGLNHSTVPEAIMFAFYNGIRRNLHADDIAGIASIYGAANGKATLVDTSVTSPSFCTFNNRGVIAWTGTNAQRNVNVMFTENLRVMHGKVTLLETSLSGPALAVHQGRLYIAWRGVGNNQLNVMSSADGITWQNKVTLSDTTFFRPALGSYDGRLVIGWTGTDAQRRLNIIQSTDGVNWGNKLILADTSIEGPELCTLGSNLLITWAGTDAQRRLNVMSFNGTSWQNKVTLGENSTQSPSIENVNGRIILGWTGTDAANSLNTLVSSNGVNFHSKVTYGETSFFGPTVAGFGAVPLLLWTGKDTARSLNLLRIGA